MLRLPHATCSFHIILALLCIALLAFTNAPSQTSPPEAEAAALSLTMVASPDPVRPGEAVDYQIIVTNESDAEVTGLIVRSLIPGQTEAEGYTIDGGDLDGDFVRWDVGALPAGESKLLRYSAHVDDDNDAPADGTVISGNATATGDGTVGASASANVTVETTPGLTMRMTTLRRPAAPGETLTYALRYANTGETSRSGVTVEAPVPSGTEFVSASNDGTLSGGQVQWNVGTLPAGQSGRRFFTVAVDDGLSTGVLLAEATVSGGGHTTRAQEATSVEAEPALTLAMEAGPDPVQPGGQISYAITATNQSGEAATGVAVRALVPEHTRVYEGGTGGDCPGSCYSGEGLVWSVGTLPAGESVSFIFAANVREGSSAPPVGSLIASSASVSSDGGGGAGASASVAVTAAPALTLRMKADPEPVAPGEQISYTLDYREAEGTNVSGASLQAVVPAGASFVSASGGGTASDGVVEWTVGGSGQRTFTVQAGSDLGEGALLTTQATLTGGGHAASAQAVTVVRASPSLTLAMEAGPDPVQPGGQISYAITATNQSGEAATGVAVRALVPEHTRVYEGGTGGDCPGSCYSGEGLVWSVGTLPAGESVSFIFAANVREGSSAPPNGTVIPNNSAIIGSINDEIRGASASAHVLVGLPSGGGDDSPPSPPAGLAASAGEEQVALSWDPNTEDDLNEYRLYRSTSPNPTTQIATIAAGTESYTDTGVEGGVTYRYRLTAADDSGNESGYSDEVAVAPSSGADLTITSVEPDTVTGSDEDQPLTVRGIGFEEGAFVILDDLDDDQPPFENPDKTTFVSSIELVRQATFTENAATWIAVVENPDGEQSEPVEFEVVAPGGGGGGVSVSEVPLAGSFRMPIGKIDRNDLGENLTLLERGEWPGSEYPRIRFNDDGDQEADPNEWYVFTAHNRDENLTGAFGGDTEPYSESGAYHPGEDWNLTSGTDEGKPVLAVADGTVLHDACVGNYGRALIVAHKTNAGEFVTSFYAHLEDTGSFHEVGQRVDKDETLGTIGRTGDANCSNRFGPHLHFEVRKESMLDPEALSNGFVELQYKTSTWPATVDPSNNGQSFIAEHYYNPSEFIDEYEGSPPSGEACPSNPPTNENPSFAEISDCIDHLAEKWRVPGLVVRALLEQENGPEGDHRAWAQFKYDGTYLGSGEREGIGLTQITQDEVLNGDAILPLADEIIDSQQEGRNFFTTSVEVRARADLNDLQSNWAFNLETGVRHLLAKKAAKAPQFDMSGVGAGEAGSDNRILENWYNALAFYNGFTGCANNPGEECGYDRNPDRIEQRWKDVEYFPYQEAVYNALAQRYDIENKDAKDFPANSVEVTLPGPEAVSSDAGYDFAWANYSGSKYLNFYSENGEGWAQWATNCGEDRLLDDPSECNWSWSGPSRVPVEVHRVSSFSDHNATAVGNSLRSNVAVSAGETGTIPLGDSGAEVNITENGDADGGELRSVRYDETPSNNTFGGSAEAPDGSTVTPGAVANRFWDISTSDLTDLRYRVRLDASGIGYAGDRDKLLVLKREDSGSPWTALNTTREGEELVSEVLDSFSEFTIGWSAQTATIPVSINRSFGDASESSDYLLVALPGADEVPLPDVLEGEAGAGWQAFRQSDGGSGLTAYRDDPESFQFGPGRGFWVIATSDLTREATAEAVEIGEDGTYALDLHDGWNIISNPFEKDLSWSAVQEASGASQTIHAFTGGSYAQPSTFASAAGGESYYFYNQENLDQLVLPYASEASSAPARLASEDGSPEAPRVAEAAWTLALTAERRVASEQDSGQRVYATVRTGATQGAKAGFDARDQFAPPGRFEAVSLGLRPPSDSLAGAELAAEYRPPAADGDEGHRFPLVLRSAPGEEVTLRAEGAARLAGGRQALLVREATGEHFRLSDEAVRFTPEAAEERLVLVVGSAAFTEAAAQDAAPPEPALIGAYPNPFRGRATVAYAVSEPSRVRLTVYDVLGRKVRTLVDETQSVGRKKAMLRARSLSSGVYLFRLRIGDYVETGRLVLVR